ncbi:MAG: peptidase M61, partial [Ferruginibacter sp.]
MNKLLCLFLTFLSINVQGQNTYSYSVDLTEVHDDQLDVSLLTPKISKSSINFKFPKIIPGTYKNADYGRFVSNLKAFDKAGKQLPVKQADMNTWSITNATQLYKITYTIQDTWDSEPDPDVFTMAGTNIEEGKNFVVNTPGFFGYLDGYRNSTFVLDFKKPENFYASTSLKPVSSSATNDRFQLPGLDALYDSPIMFCLPDTTTIKLGGADILVSVYSPKRKISAAVVAQGLTQNLRASAKYLGGSLPVNHYAFLFYFNGEQKPSIAQGALEHNYSSFYTIQENGPQNIMPYVLDVTAHEFFHILTPLNFSSREIKEFNFDKPVLSKHLWLYEGTTEYASDHVQVKYGLNSIPEFLGKLTEKIRRSQKLNDTLPFTRMSKEVATTYKSQYLNVYEKGALISACLDLELLRLSNGTYSLQQLKHDLSIKFGADKYFEDDQLFDIIAKMTYPEVRKFFTRYVEGSMPIPYDYYFGLAGVQIVPERKYEEFSLGGFGPTYTPEGKVIIGDMSRINSFGKNMGYKENDQVVSIQGINVNQQNLFPVVGQVRSKLKTGDRLTVVVMREGNSSPIELSAEVIPNVTILKNVVELMPEISESQARIRNAWLST